MKKSLDIKIEDKIVYFYQEGWVQMHIIYTIKRNWKTIVLISFTFY
jgi:hypothetical protein